MGSWTDGSLEAPLEALWVASEFQSLDAGSFEAKVVEFYDTFYDYDIQSKMGSVLDGSYAR